MGGGQSQVSNIGLAKGQGYRILSVRANSPLETKVDIFFDFIIDVVATQEAERSPKQILSKLTEQSSKIPKKAKSLTQIFRENQNKQITLKVVSTKYRNVKMIEVTPNKNWDGTQDLIGIQTRLQRYDQAFETYFPFSDIRQGSPIKKGGVNEGQYLIGCYQFKYCSINQLLQNIYDRFFDKSIQDKTIRFSVYNISRDELRVCQIVLARGWGDKGLLGCQFLEGHLSRFPKNLLERRDQINLKKKQSDQSQKIRKQLNDCNGASVQLIESLKSQKNKRKKAVQGLKKIMVIQPLKSEIREEKEEKVQIIESQMINAMDKKQKYVPYWKYKELEDRVSGMEQVLSNLRGYIEKLGDSFEQDQIS